MQFDLSKQVMNYDGTSLTQQDPSQPSNPEAKVSVTFKDVITNALNTVDASTPPDEKAKAFELTQRAFSVPALCEYSHEDIAHIMKCVKKVYIPLVIGRTQEFFDTPIIPQAPQASEQPAA